MALGGLREELAGRRSAPVRPTIPLRVDREGAGEGERVTSTALEWWSEERGVGD